MSTPAISAYADEIEEGTHPIDPKDEHGRMEESSYMPLPRHLLPSWIKIKRIWIALDCRCEICGDEVQLNHLILHHIVGGEGECEDRGSLEGSMLALCPACHRELHAQCIDEEEQLKLVTSRPEELREGIRHILCHESKPYTPPDPDMEQLYEEAKQVGQLIFGV